MKGGKIVSSGYKKNSDIKIRSSFYNVYI